MLYKIYLDNGMKLFHECPNIETAEKQAVYYAQIFRCKWEKVEPKQKLDIRRNSEKPLQSNLQYPK